MPSEGDIMAVLGRGERGRGRGSCRGRASGSHHLLNLIQEVSDMGSAEAARAIEPLCMLWCIPGFLRNDWSHAFKMLS